MWYAVRSAITATAGLLVVSSGDRGYNNARCILDELREAENQTPDAIA